MTSISLHELIAQHVRKSQSNDPPVQVVVHPDNVGRLLEESGDEHPFERDGAGGYVAFGLPAFLDRACPGVVVMGTAQRELWEQHQLDDTPFGPLSRR